MSADQRHMWNTTSAAASRVGSLYTALSVRSLPLLVSATGLQYCLLLLVLQAPRPWGLIDRTRSTHTLDEWPWLRVLLDALWPDAFAMAAQSRQALASRGLFALLAVGLVVAWVAALWLVRPGQRTIRVRWILLAILIYSLPLMALPYMFSNDVYNYAFYGRIISTYNENPMLVPPKAFPGDPHLRELSWKSWPAIYGPLWLMLSAGLSALAGDSVFANLITYKAAFLCFHFLTTGVVWAALRKARPDLAAWGAVFYGWNPLVLFETVGNAHNDVLVGLLISLSLLVLRDAF